MRSCSIYLCLTLSLSIMPSRFIHIAAKGGFPSFFFFFFLVENIPFCVNVAHFLNPFTHGWTVRLFPCLASVNDAAVNMAVWISLK